MADPAATTLPWKLINMKVRIDILDRIDTEARSLGMTRTAYMVNSSDPEKPKARRTKSETGAAQ
jgi:hypothetical protein